MAVSKRRGYTKSLIAQPNQSIPVSQFSLTAPERQVKSMAIKLFIYRKRGSVNGTGIAILLCVASEAV